MIAFQPTEPPPTFDERCRQPGLRWLEQHPDAARPRDFWSQFRSDLADAFRDLCAYCAIYTPSGTVDHFVSCNEDRRLAYEWSNMRFAQHWINSSKQDCDGLLDPFEVQDDELTPSRSPGEWTRAGYVVKASQSWNGGTH